MTTFDGPDDGASAAPLLDAAASDAGQRAYDWERLRRKPESFTATRTAAWVTDVRVLDISPLYFEAGLDRGRLAGVERGWMGVLLDSHGYPKALDIDVIEVSDRRCVVRTNANPDQLKAYARVVLWNPQATEAP